MKTKITRDAIVCDGCDYIIPYGVQVITLTVRSEVFHFHDGGQGAAERHDCFRLWAHGPYVMKRSLKEREWDEDRVDEFLSLMLYRTQGAGPFSSSPGIPREPPPPPVRKEGVKV